MHSIPPRQPRLRRRRPARVVIPPRLSTRSRLAPLHLPVSAASSLPALRAEEGRQQTDRAGAGDRAAYPAGEPTRAIWSTWSQALARTDVGLEQHTEVAELRRDPDRVLRLDRPQLAAVAVGAHDPALDEAVVAAHVPVASGAGGARRRVGPSGRCRRPGRPDGSPIAAARRSPRRAPRGRGSGGPRPPPSRRRRRRRSRDRCRDSDQPSPDEQLSVPPRRVGDLLRGSGSRSARRDGHREHADSLPVRSDGASPEPDEASRAGARPCADGRAPLATAGRRRDRCWARGVVAALRSARLGAATALITRDAFGGMAAADGRSRFARSPMPRG